MTRNTKSNGSVNLVLFALCSALGMMMAATPALAVPLPSPGNLQVWLKGDTGVTTGTGGVSQWDDQSGNGNHATQGTDADRPDVGGTFNGHTFLDFADATDFFNMPTLTYPNGGNGMHVFLVSRTTDLATGTVWLGNLSSSLIFTAEASGTSNLRFRANTGTEAVIGPIDPTVFHISEYWFDGTDTLRAIFNSIGGTILTGGGTEQFIIDNIAGYPFGSWKGEGELAEVLIYDRRLNALEANRTGTYLAERYGIAAVNYDFFDPNAVPEPSTAVLTLCGIAALASRRSRRRKAANR